MQRTDLPVESSVDDLQTLTASWRRHLRAANLAPKTIRTYLKAADGLRSFPAERGMPTAVAATRREHVEAYVGVAARAVEAGDRERAVPALQQLFRFLIDEGEIAENVHSRWNASRLRLTGPD